MSGFHENLWAPWRMEYIHALADPAQTGCFLCDYRDQPARDAEHHLVWRTAEMLVLLNRFPYTNGHLLIAPTAHAADLEDLSDLQLAALIRHTRDAKRALSEALAPQGFNVGINLGHCAGAGLPGHIHIHIVPRWSGDTNYMSVLGDVRVIPEALERVCEKLRSAAVKLGLPTLP